MAIYPSNGQVRFGDYESEVIELNPFLGMGEVLVARDTGSAKMGPGHWNDLPTLGAVGGGGGGVTLLDSAYDQSVSASTAVTHLFQATIPQRLAGSHFVIEAEGYINAASAGQGGAGSNFTFSLSWNGSTGVLEGTPYSMAAGQFQRWYLRYDIIGRDIVSSAKSHITGRLVITDDNSGYFLREPLKTYIGSTMENAYNAPEQLMGVAVQMSESHANTSVLLRNAHAWQYAAGA